MLMLLALVVLLPLIGAPIMAMAAVGGMAAFFLVIVLFVFGFLFVCIGGFCETPFFMSDEQRDKINIDLCT